MYSEGFPEISTNDRSVSLSLRDLFFYFESKTAPQILVQEASLSYAVSMLLDSIGFSNYLFKRIDDESEPIIPYFFIAPDKTIAQVLNEIAISTQSAMFFDEYNNLVVMTKEYILPSNDERDVDLVLYGTKDFEAEGQISNKTTNAKLCLLYTSPSPRDGLLSRMPSSA